MNIRWISQTVLSGEPYVNSAVISPLKLFSEFQSYIYYIKKKKFNILCPQPVTISESGDKLVSIENRFIGIDINSNHISFGFFWVKSLYIHKKKKKI